MQTQPTLEDVLRTSWPSERARVAGVLTGRTDRTCEVMLPGGPLSIEWRESDNRIYMTGPATRVYEGSYKP